MTALSDQHTIEYDFEELQPTIGGIRLDVLFSGRAVLARDPSYTFFVQSITLPGSIKDRTARPSLFGGHPRREAGLTLVRRAADDQSTEARLFRMIEEAIYDDQSAIDAWEGEQVAA